MTNKTTTTSKPTTAKAETVIIKNAKTIKELKAISKNGKLKLDKIAEKAINEYYKCKIDEIFMDKVVDYRVKHNVDADTAYKAVRKGII